MIKMLGIIRAAPTPFAKGDITNTLHLSQMEMEPLITNSMLITYNNIFYECIIDHFLLKIHYINIYLKFKKKRRFFM